ncbi:amidase family protein [Paenibacillus nasutitermitis]|uniref:Amidase n=1 Tax=Paenibacillus nasutitermitis TaxID=1652958 RepID=A0A916ZAR6_9BACL|nr:amidase family protein [Paenibacillus nasutitermitis]GGD84623.1 amidase [Paenibacillus nasutitermitis]
MENKWAEWIVEADIPRMQQAMENGSLSSEELVQAYMDRIRKVDGLLRSILELNPDAPGIAKALDKERREQGSRGTLHGIPVLLKDNIGTADSLHTSAGSIALADHYAVEDSFVAAKLRRAGAVLLGKTNMTEWANAMSSSMWAGYSSRGGLTLNPYGPGEFFVGGSSSGSAVAIAANLAAAAVGTETAGSIVCPASQNFIVGLKPTVGLVSRSGIIPFARSQDTAGPMTRTVTDAAILLGALAGEDERDEATMADGRRALADYSPFLDRSFLKTARIGVPRFYYQELEGDEERLAIIEQAIATLREAGATVIDPVSLPCEQQEWGNVMGYELKSHLNDYLSGLDESLPVHSLKDVIAFNEAHAEQALKYGQDGLIRCEATSGTLTEQNYLDAKAQNKEHARSQGIDYVLKEHSLDALLLPGCWDGSDIAGKAGYPLIAVPAGYSREGATSPGGYPTKGPFGVIFSGAAYSEPALIAIAFGFEQASRHRFPPALD